MAVRSRLREFEAARRPRNPLAVDRGQRMCSRTATVAGSLCRRYALKKYVRTARCSDHRERLFFEENQINGPERARTRGSPVLLDQRGTPGPKR